ncbi:MAG: acyloxyacyl hydrolase [Gemmatimonadaceae bacterium]|nr:acyloxyacyl hydrolase [Gemmatimonadaceae bacterium]
MNKRCWLLAAGCCLFPIAAAADSTTVEKTRVPPEGAGVSSRPWWFGAWAGAATHSPFETRHGHRNRDFYIAAIRVGRELDTSRRYAYDYFVEIIPLLRQTNIPVEYREVVTCGPGGSSCSTKTVMVTETARGFGVTPLGLQVRVFPSSRFHLAFGLSMGVVLYDSPVPDPEEKRLNFMGDISAGVQMRVGRASNLIAGLRQNHTSNGFTGPTNPGLDARVLYVGATRSLGRGLRR